MVVIAIIILILLVLFIRNSYTCDLYYSDNDNRKYKAIIFRKGKWDIAFAIRHLDIRFKIQRGKYYSKRDSDLYRRAMINKKYKRCSNCRHLKPAILKPIYIDVFDWCEKNKMHTTGKSKCNLFEMNKETSRKVEVNYERNY